MTKNTYFADFDGHVVMRKTDRTYAYAVACKANYERDLAFSSKPDKYDRKNHEFYCRCVRDNNFAYCSEAEIERMKKNAAMTADQYVADQVARRVAQVEDNKKNGYYDRFLAPSFTSRLDLAEKEASAMRRAGNLDVRIVPVTKKP